jgi:broad specificity polyphosphatase/5'/3'-nucleotidase SurE
MEASLLGFRAMATSMALPNDQFETIRESCGKKMDNQVRKSLRHSAEACAQYALDVIAAPVPEGLVVHNLNFPIGYDGEHDPMISFAGSLNLGSFFEKGDEEKAYQLVYHPERLEAAKVEVGSDLWVMREGMPSVSRLDFSEASGKTYLEP